MIALLKNQIPAGIAAMAITISLGFALSTNTAEARPAFLKLEGVPGEAKAAQKSQRSVRRAPRQVCCSLPRKGSFQILKPVQCRRLKGTVAPLKKCGQAGAKASDAYFVKVDRDTTTQNRISEVETTQSGDDEPR